MSILESHEVHESHESNGSQEGLRYDSILARADTIYALIVEGTLDPSDGLALAAWPPEEVREVERAREEAEARKMRRRFSSEARERAVALVAGGASFRMAAAAALGDERYRMSVWRWARESGLA